MEKKGSENAEQSGPLGEGPSMSTSNTDEKSQLISVSSSEQIENQSLFAEISANVGNEAKPESSEMAQATVNSLLSPSNEFGDPNKAEASNSESISKDVSLALPASSSSSDLSQATNNLSSSRCPFHKLHRKISAELLSPPVDTDNNKDAASAAVGENVHLPGIEDSSEGVGDKIKNIIGNLENYGGVWQVNFLEKLNGIIIHADPVAIKACFQEADYSLAKSLVKLFSEENKCCKIFRYWCTFYNILLKNLIPHPILIKSGLLNKLQNCFVLAADQTCTCKTDVKCTCKGPPDEEHLVMSSQKQLLYLTSLMTALYTSGGSSDEMGLQMASRNNNLFAKKLIYVVVRNVEEINEEYDFYVQQDEDAFTYLLASFNSNYYNSCLNTETPGATGTPPNPVVKVIKRRKEYWQCLRWKLLKIFTQEYQLLSSGCKKEKPQNPRDSVLVKLFGMSEVLKLFINLLQEDYISLFDKDDLEMLHIYATSLSNSERLQDGTLTELHSTTKKLVECLEKKLGVLAADPEVTEDELMRIIAWRFREKGVSLVNRKETFPQHADDDSLSSDSSSTSSSNYSVSSFKYNMINPLPDPATHIRILRHKVVKIKEPSKFISNVLGCFGCSRTKANAKVGQM